VRVVVVLLLDCRDKKLARSRAVVVAETKVKVKSEIHVLAMKA
jgi:hypothetical protein